VGLIGFCYARKKSSTLEICVLNSPQASKSIFLLVWPWSLTFWPLELTVSFPCPVGRLCQLASKLVHSFSKYRVHTSLVTEERIKEWTDGRTNGQVENNLARRTHNNYINIAAVYWSCSDNLCYAANQGPIHDACVVIATGDNDR